MEVVYTSRQGPALYLTLQGDARDAIRSMDKSEIAKDNGVDLIIAELDKVYLKDKRWWMVCRDISCLLQKI